MTAEIGWFMKLTIWIDLNLNLQMNSFPQSTITFTLDPLRLPSRRQLWKVCFFQDFWQSGTFMHSCQVTLDELHLLWKQRNRNPNRSQGEGRWNTLRQFWNHQKCLVLTMKWYLATKLIIPQGVKFILGKGKAVYWPFKVSASLCPVTTHAADLNLSKTKSRSAAATMQVLAATWGCFAPKDFSWRNLRNLLWDKLSFKPVWRH
jgi:hypothetical protein